MSFLQRERDRLFAAMAELEYGSPAYKEVYGANQALSWALDPTGFKSPADMLLGEGAYVSATFAPGSLEAALNGEGDIAEHVRQVILELRSPGDSGTWI